MKTALSVVILALLCYVLNAQTTTGGTGFNYSSFTSEKKTITPELQSLTDKHFYEHPEYGVLPFNAPCTDCAEILQKRDETHRYFVKNGSNGKQFYQQTAYSPLSYRENGRLLTIDSRLKPAAQQGVYEAKHQPFPVTINVPEKFTSILDADKELQVNRNVTIFIQHSDGSVTSLGEPDWSNYTAGDEGIFIHNFYPGIDLELRAGGGNIESFYRINKPLHLTDGWLVVRDNMKVPEGLVIDYSRSEKLENGYNSGSLYINDAAGKNCFSIASPAAYDENGGEDNSISLNYQLADNSVYDLYVPIAWMNDAKRSYPLIIDPLVSVTTSLPPSGINSGYDAVCFQNGCSYILNAEVPSGGIITDITNTFWYYAFNPCHLSNGAFDIALGGCQYPNVPYSCSIATSGRCQTSNTDVFNPFQPCLPAPSCDDKTLSFKLNLYRCEQPGSGCAFSCINGDNVSGQPWSITITGTYLDANTGFQATSVCTKGSTTLSVIDTFGLGPFSYNWNPGGMTTKSIQVSPSSTTTYTVTVNNVCGDTVTNTVTVVVDSVKPPAHISGVSANLCRGDTVQLDANTRIGLSYKWYHDGYFISGAAGSSYGATKEGSYYCIVHDGCGDSTSNILSISEDTLAAKFIVIGDTNQLHHYFIIDMSVGIPPLSYYWNWGDSTYDTIPYPSHVYANAGYYNICLTITDSIGCSNKYCMLRALMRSSNPMIYVNVVPPVITSAKETELQAYQLYVYPNPANTQLTLHFLSNHSNEAIKISIMNMLGEIMQEEIKASPQPSPKEREYTINTKTLSPGIYIVQVSNERGRWVGEFVKE